MDEINFDAIVEQITTIKNEVMAKATQTHTLNEEFLQITSQFIMACEGAASNVNWAKSEFFNLFPPEPEPMPRPGEESEENEEDGVYSAEIDREEAEMLTPAYNGDKTFQTYYQPGEYKYQA